MDIFPPTSHGKIHLHLGQDSNNDVGANILALHTRDVPLQGGDQVLASSAAIIQRLGTKHPELVQELLKPN